MAIVKITGAGADMVEPGLSAFVKFDTVKATPAQLVSTMSDPDIPKLELTNTFEGEDFTYYGADRFIGGKVTDWPCG